MDCAMYIAGDSRKESGKLTNAEYVQTSAPTSILVPLLPITELYRDVLSDCRGSQTRPTLSLISAILGQLFSSQLLGRVFCELSQMKQEFPIDKSSTKTAIDNRSNFRNCEWIGRGEYILSSLKSLHNKRVSSILNALYGKQNMEQNRYYAVSPILLFRCFVSRK